MPIHITKEAANQIFKNKYLRIGIIGSGCKGFSYLIEYADTKKDNDLVFEKDGATVIVDPKSIKLLEGSTIDYHASLIKSQFIINNPNAISSCGCNKSFDIKSSK